jgi:hypothetical protein
MSVRLCGRDEGLRGSPCRWRVQPQASAYARSFAQPARRNERDTAESVFGLPNRPTCDAFPAEASGIMSRSSSVTAARQRRICTDFPCIQPPRTRLPKRGYYTASDDGWRGDGVGGGAIACGGAARAVARGARAGRRVPRLGACAADCPSRRAIVGAAGAATTQLGAPSRRARAAGVPHAPRMVLRAGVDRRTRRAHPPPRNGTAGRGVSGVGGESTPLL